jgi:hypothetical protein
MKNIAVGTYTTKPTCESHECSLAELCATVEGRRQIADGITDAAEANDTSLLHEDFVDGHNNPKGNRATHCVHLARRIAQCVPELDQASVGGVEALLEWSVGIGYSSMASITQPRE